MRWLWPAKLGIKSSHAACLVLPFWKFKEKYLDALTVFLKINWYRYRPNISSHYRVAPLVKRSVGFYELEFGMKSRRSAYETVWRRNLSVLFPLGVARKPWSSDWKRNFHVLDANRRFENWQLRNNNNTLLFMYIYQRSVKQRRYPTDSCIRRCAILFILATFGLQFYSA